MHLYCQRNLIQEDVCAHVLAKSMESLCLQEQMPPPDADLDADFELTNSKYVDEFIHLKDVQANEDQQHVFQQVTNMKGGLVLISGGPKTDSKTTGGHQVTITGERSLLPQQAQPLDA